jgi:hypothetical protein
MISWRSCSKLWAGRRGVPSEGLRSGYLFFSQQAFLVRPGGQLRPGMEAQLGEHVVDVRLDRPDREEQPGGNVPVR